MILIVDFKFIYHTRGNFRRITIFVQNDSFFQMGKDSIKLFFQIGEKVSMDLLPCTFSP